MSKASRWRRRFCFALAVATLFGPLAACSPDDPESPQSKHEWSILQSIEYSARSKPIVEPEFLRVQKYELLSLPAQGGGRIWILLKPASTPYYKQMPTGPYVVKKALVDSLVREQRVSEAVAHVLRSHEEN